MRRALSTSVVRERPGGLEAGGWPAWICSEYNSGVGAGVGCLELMTDPPRGSPRNDFIYSVRAGSPRIDQISQTTADVPALQVIVNERYQSHRYWSWVGQANNIALVKLAWALKYNAYIWPICLPNLDFQVKDHSVCTVTGWGLPRVDGESEPPQTGWVGSVWERTQVQARI